MELVIDIPENLYNFVNTKRPNGYYNEFDKFDTYDISKAIRNGIPLPKQHGDLIDRNECLKLKMTDLYNKDGITMYAVPTGNILRMKPVIEADKGE